MGRKGDRTAWAVRSFSLAENTPVQFSARRGDDEFTDELPQWNANRGRRVRRDVTVSNDPTIQRNAYRAECRRSNLYAEAADLASGTDQQDGDDQSAEASEGWQWRPRHLVRGVITQASNTGSRNADRDEPNIRREARNL